MKIKALLTISAAANIFLLYFVMVKPKEKEPDYKPILDSIIIENKARLKADSIRDAKRVDSLNKRIKTINYLRKNERNKYEAEISKFNRPFDSTMFARTNDSIKKMCCPNHPN